MKKVAVVTSTRAEYGLLSPIIKQLRKFESNNFSVDLLVTGTHLSSDYGMTVEEIYADGVRVDYEIPISVESTTEFEISRNQADALIKFTDMFQLKKYDGVVLLGDRYEMLAIAIAAGNTHTPIFHISGGDTTEGALDEWIRHSITKMSYLHFPSNEESRQRVIQLGENPDRVFNFGSTSIDNILTLATMSKEEALKNIGLEICNYALCTYHPVTMEKNTVEIQIEQFIEAIKSFPMLQFIVTKSNADQGGGKINELLDSAANSLPNMHVFTSLGAKRYLSLMRFAEFVLGNSSSGIIETPAFKIPTVNIGDRQKGRLQVDSIINCEADTISIRSAINKALSNDFKNKCKYVNSPYGNGDAATRISNIIYDTIINCEVNFKKSFYNINI